MGMDITSGIFQRDHLCTSHIKKQKGRFR